MTKNPPDRARHRRDGLRPWAGLRFSRPTSRSSRRSCAERAVADGWLDLAARGQAFGFGALVLILATIITLAVLGQPWLAGVVATSSLVGVVGIFVTGRFQSQSDADRELEPPESVRRSGPQAPGLPPTPRSGVE